MAKKVVDLPWFRCIIRITWELVEKDALPETSRYGGKRYPTELDHIVSVMSNDLTQSFVGIMIRLELFHEYLLHTDVSGIEFLVPCNTESTGLYKSRRAI